MDENLEMSANLDRMSVQWQPPTMLEVIFTLLNVGQKFAAHHDAISEKTILRMAIENIRNSGILDIALRNWELQTTQSYWEEFIVFMYKAEKYRRDTSATTRSAGFSANFHIITLKDVHCPTSLAITSTSDISELESAFSSAADAQTSQITALMAAMIDQRLTGNTNKARRTGARQGSNQRGEKIVLLDARCHHKHGT